MLKTEKWFSARISELEPCKYDILPVSFYDDREIPTTMLLTVCREMSKKWKYPKFSMEIPSVFMEKLEAKYGDYIPTLRGDISDQWADFATISPDLTAKKRQAMRMLYDGEMLSVLDSVNGCGKYEPQAFRDVCFKLSEFDEHCWATSSKHPQKMHRHNMDRVKKSSVELSLEKLSCILNTACPVAEGDKISVTSTIPQKRVSRITSEAGSLIPKGLDHQILPNGTVVTAPLAFNGIETREFEGAMPHRCSEKILTEQFDTDFYTVNLNCDTKKIVSIVDKATGTEYLDKDARFELGQFIYAYTEEKTSPNLCFEIPKKTDFKVYEGDIAYVLVQKGYEEQSGANTTAQFVFYKHEPTIDVDLEYENATGLIGDFYDRYKKNYFFAFPFKLSSPKFYTEMHAGEKNEGEEYIPLNANDFAVTQNWVCAEDSHHGVAVYTRDMPVFHLGSIKYNRLKNDFCEDKGHVFLYASSNRCNNLIYTSLDECRAKYHLSILPYNGGHADKIPQWSNERVHSLTVSKRTPHAPLLCLSEQNVRLVSVKKAEGEQNAIVLRFVETAGHEGKCCLELCFKPTKATYVTNGEEELEVLPLSGKTVTFSYKPYSYTTIKIFGNFEI